ncbi:3-deoxy-7-phosphoheptulonate synthase [candidate division KSB1 bacterium]|nr:3-deoxy-7-phosphoheptulonate synthase [candidate division KSB1 bacterium]NIR68941.1 3-deoxy-7-phosphoheptulonate synthase [candidate division KSB1 bacterium]NIS27278.1 3-deoxy-7-phosphoheptulonate synthase [candidate division KSB1 bacterium]NIT74157.1 3-deoxy-7-phosphoheptulonate synthase [candidate division KSB1 bacterium]NIU28008.1 3-deoxy-7-phosphoheptulonate synthase [candidate division KSB1 bacterium]
MVVVMEEMAKEDQIQHVISKLIDMSFDVHRSTGVNQTVLGAIGDKRGLDTGILELLPGVHKVVRITEAFKLASRTFHPQDTVIKIRNVTIGGDDLVMMAGPCSVEAQNQISEIAQMVRTAGATVLRGGAFKPRTSPYSFQGLGEDGLTYLREAANKHDMVCVSEVMESSQIPLLTEYVDVLQVGARNMQNFSLLRELGKIRKPVLLKRGMAATIEEMLMAAEYIMAGGNYDVILCERGIRTFENYTRNTLDISAIPVVKKLSHLPIIADPSHATGRRDKVPPMARAAIAAGADGLIVEVHQDPEKALSDGAQSLYPEQFEHLMGELRIIAKAVSKKW